jgi:hypothetical protein
VKKCDGRKVRGSEAFLRVGKPVAIVDAQKRKRGPRALASTPLPILARGVRAVDDSAAVGARWSEPETQAERRREIERLQAQLGQFFQHETERQEARINRESDERIAALTGRDS